MWFGLSILHPLLWLRDLEIWRKDWISLFCGTNPPKVEAGEFWSLE